MKKSKALLSIFLSAVAFAACEKRNDDRVAREQANMRVIEAALDSFVYSLVLDPPSQADLASRIYTYVSSHPTSFYGSTVTMFDTNGAAAYSPYIYRKYGSFESVSLMAASYKIDSQAWLREPVDTHLPIWTVAYFDAGGGDIWMRTRSVPIYSNGKIFAVATTDLAVEKP